VTGARRSVSRLLASLAVRVSPDPDYVLTKALADMICGRIVGYGVAGRRFTPGDGKDVSY
jgi:hypothetical protein